MEASQHFNNLETQKENWQTARMRYVSVILEVLELRTPKSIILDHGRSHIFPTYSFIKCMDCFKIGQSAKEFSSFHSHHHIYIYGAKFHKCSNLKCKDSLIIPNNHFSSNLFIKGIIKYTFFHKYNF